jgi:hypothetical protein
LILIVYVMKGFRHAQKRNIPEHESYKQMARVIKVC